MSVMMGSIYFSNTDIGYINTAYLLNKYTFMSLIILVNFIVMCFMMTQCQMFLQNATRIMHALMKFLFIKKITEKQDVYFILDIMLSCTGMLVSGYNVFVHSHSGQQRWITLVESNIFMFRRVRNKQLSFMSILKLEIALCMK